ncbi:MAG: hypothetical protein WBH40_07860 [Ignavibacteriaceae bacterium]
MKTKKKYTLKELKFKPTKPILSREELFYKLMPKDKAQRVMMKYFAPSEGIDRGK